MFNLIITKLIVLVTVSTRCLNQQKKRRTEREIEKRCKSGGKRNVGEERKEEKSGDCILHVGGGTIVGG